MTVTNVTGDSTSGARDLLKEHKVDPNAHPHDLDYHTDVNSSAAATGEPLVWDGTEWVPSGTLIVGPDTGSNVANNGGIDVRGKVTYMGHNPFSYDGLLSGEFLIIGDSLTSPSGGGVIKYGLTSDGAGLVTAISNSTTDTGWARSFVLTIRGVNESYLRVNCTVVAGAITTMVIRNQVGVFSLSMVNVAGQQTSTDASWAYLLWNSFALNGEIDAVPATSYGRPGTGYVLPSDLPVVLGSIALVVLGGNDVGGIDLGAGLAPGGTTADLTPAQLQTDCEALYTALIASGYRVIIAEAAYSEFTKMFSDSTWDQGTDLVNTTIRAAAAAVGLSEIWSFTTPATGDGLHPSQTGHELMMQGFYPRMVSAATVDRFDSLNDTPSTKVGNALKSVRVNAGATALEYFTSSGSGATEAAITQASHGLTVLDCVRWNGTVWAKAQANDVNTTALGVVVAVADVDNFTYAIAGRYAITHGLTVDEWYYLSAATAGGLTATEPSISQPIVYAEDATHLSVYAYRPSYSSAATVLILTPIKTAAYTAVVGDLVPMSTTAAARVLTLPASPVVGDKVGWIDYDGTFATNNLTVGRNAKNIMGLAQDMVVSTNNANASLIYVDATKGWMLI